MAKAKKSTRKVSNKTTSETAKSGSSASSVPSGAALPKSEYFDPKFIQSLQALADQCDQMTKRFGPSGLRHFALIGTSSSLLDLDPSVAELVHTATTRRLAKERVDRAIVDHRSIHVAWGHDVNNPGHMKAGTAVAYSLFHTSQDNHEAVEEFKAIASQSYRLVSDINDVDFDLWALPFEPYRMLRECAHHLWTIGMERLGTITRVVRAYQGHPYIRKGSPNNEYEPKRVAKLPVGASRLVLGRGPRWAELPEQPGILKKITEMISGDSVTIWLAGDVFQNSATMLRWTVHDLRRNIGVALPASSKQTYKVIEVLWKKKAFTPDCRVNTTEIAAAISRGQNPTELQVSMACLKEHGVIDTKEGRGGGNWFTTDGKDVAREIVKRREQQIL